MAGSQKGLLHIFDVTIECSILCSILTPITIKQSLKVDYSAWQQLEALLSWTICDWDITLIWLEILFMWKND